MLTWAILANASKKQQALISELGNYMGMAFQMRDDYLDIIGGDKTKSTFSDIQEWQQTYFTNYIFAEGTPEQKKLLKSSMGKTLWAEKITTLQAMFEASGAINFGKESILKYSWKAREILEKTALNDESKASILALIKKMEKVKH